MRRRGSISKAEIALRLDCWLIFRNKVGTLAEEFINSEQFELPHKACKLLS